MYELKLNLPNVGRGVEVEIDGLGTFKNGTTVEVSKAQAENFRQRNMVTEFETNDKGELQSKFKPGPTVLEAFRDTEGVDVVKAETKHDDDPVTVKAPKTVTESTAPTPTPHTDKKKGGNN